MRARVGPLGAEVWLGESERFTSPLLLIHGLWDSAAVWRGYSGFLTHRGWRCIAVELRGREDGDPGPGLAGHLADLRAAIAALEAPPVLVGHDVGALLALQAATEARAVAALAPLLPAWLGDASARAFARAGSWLSRWHRDGLTAPGGRWRSAYPFGVQGRLESADFVHELSHGSVRIAPIPPGVPGIVIAGTRDPVVPVRTAEKLAEHVGAEFRAVAECGHALPVEASWQASVSDLHRWIIRRLGAPLLEFYEEDTASD